MLGSGSVEGGAHPGKEGKGDIKLGAVWVVGTVLEAEDVGRGGSRGSRWQGAPCTHVTLALSR